MTGARSPKINLKFGFYFESWQIFGGVSTLCKQFCNFGTTNTMMKFSLRVRTYSCWTCLTVWCATFIASTGGESKADVSRYSGGDLLTDDEGQVQITNNGPTILGAETTYIATISPQLATPENMCYWEEWKCGKLIPYHKITPIVNRQCNTTSHYKCKQDIGSHKMYLVVLSNPSQQPVVESSSVVEITEFINTRFIIKQGNNVCNTTTSKCLVTTKKSMQMTVDIHDPSNFFNGSYFGYEWEFGDGTSEANLMNVTTHDYSLPGTYTVKVNITAVMPDEKKRYGFVTYTVHTLDAINNMTLKGSTDLTAGSSGQFNITCNGSVPVSFCWSVSQQNLSRHNSFIMNNSTCIWTMYSPYCNDSFNYRFNYSGTYYVAVQAFNNVSMQIAQSKINVKMGKVAEYSSIAGALICGIILCLISIALVLHSYRTQRMRHIEVANFDFQSSDSRVKDSSFTQRLKTMWTHPKSTHEERMKLLDVANRNFASELDVL